MWLLRSSLAPYVLLFDPKPLIEDSNLQVHMQLCMDEKSLRSLFELATEVKVEVITGILWLQQPMYPFLF